MKRGKQNRSKKSPPKHSLSLPDLDQARSAVLISLPSKESQRGYRHAIDEFITWYCSEPRLSFNKAVVTRYRIHLESRQLAPGTINGRLAAVRRLAYEAADSDLLSPDLAAGIRRVQGPKNLGVRLGNRTVPVPDWVKNAIDAWLVSPGVSESRAFRCVCRAGKTWGTAVTERVVWHVVKECAKRAAIDNLAPHDLRRTCARRCRDAGGELDQIQFLGHVSVQTERYLGCKQRLRNAVNDRTGIEPVFEQVLGGECRECADSGYPKRC
jgi:site-specific recombinase XerD